MRNFLDNNAEFLVLSGYSLGVPIAFGMMVAKIGPLAIFAAVLWPATALGYFGYWLTA